MHWTWKLLLLLLILAGVGYGLSDSVKKYLAARNKVEYRTAEVTRGEIVAVVNVTGKVKPVETIVVGSFVSGPIAEMPVNFNMTVKKGDLLARIDPRLYQARKDADEAALTISRAEVERVRAQLRQARNNEQRAIALRAKRADFVSDNEMDALVALRAALEAQEKIAESAVTQAAANLKNSQANLDYTRIEAPKDGMIINRKIEPGQTLAASFQTPELFEIGVAMREHVHVYASVDESEIGMILAAQLRKEPVHFTVSSYPDDLFAGNIFQVRIHPTETQNVVTYPVVVEAKNPELKLLPGMTANVSFQIESKADVLRISNEALRFYPKKAELVREEDRQLLDGSNWQTRSASDSENNADVLPENISAEAKAEANRSRNKRHVWVQEGKFLRAVEVVIGLSDNKYGRYTELVSGDLKPGQALVTGIKEKKRNFFGG
jgi:HlyD family secretion protein